MSVPTRAPRLRPLKSLYGGNTRAVFARGLRVIARNNYLIVLTGFFEPVFYLLSMGLGLGALIGTVEFYGVEVPYAAFIAPALMAVSAMNGALYDSTMNVFFKMRYGKLYDQMLATSLGPLDVALGEILLALFRGLLYASGFMVVTTLLGLNTQTSHEDLVAHVTSGSVSMIDPSTSDRLGQLGGSVMAMVNAEINRQAAMVAYIDDFWLMMWVTLAAVPLVLLLRPPKPGGPKASMADMGH